MNKYSGRSERHLITCDSRIQAVFRSVLPEFNHSITDGHRNKERQNEAAGEGHSTTVWPNSRHNKMPSQAVDAIAYPYSWADLDGKNGSWKKLLAWCKQCLFIGYVLCRAKQMGVPLYSGIDWDKDWNLEEHKFIDLPHFEVRD